MRATYFPVPGLQLSVALDEYDVKRIQNFIEQYTANVREQCALLCDAEAARYGGVKEGPIATERGKLVYEAMSAGAICCAAAIRYPDND